MHLLETYALATGSKIKKPFIIKKYFPLPFEKYITIQNSSGMNGKCYDYFQDVIDFIFEKLQKNGYSILQIGSKEDRPLQQTMGLQGQTNINQTAFILNNAKLHVGNDSFSIHMSSAFDIPLVGLYSVTSPEIAGPFWKNDKQICLVPDNWRPSFNPNENPKTVNRIKIEKVVESINKLLFNENDIKFETLFIGDRYNDPIIECFPDQFFPEDFLKDQILNVRFDYKESITENDYQSTVNNLRFKRCSLITDKPLQLEFLFQFRNQIPLIIYDVTNHFDINFAKNLFSLGFKFIFLFKKDNNEKTLEQRKLDVIDFPQGIEIVEKPSLNIDTKQKNLFYKSNKILFANGKPYLSKSAQEEDKPILDLSKPKIQSLNDLNNINELINNDLDNILIYKEINS
jgi:hypothetical protein